MSGVHESVYLHPLALVDQGAVIGARTRIWAYAHILPGAVIGEEGNICDHTFIEGGVTLGRRVTVKCGVYLWDGLTAADDVFIGPAAVFTNDIRPRSRKHRPDWDKTSLGHGSSIGANATILPVRIGEWSFVAAGAVVTRNVPAHALVVGSPARIRGWICRCAETLVFESAGVADCACGRRFQRVGEERIVEVTHDGP
jgi:acetyltransferase-like isoleucine patch superfamily enzyme